MLNLYRENFKSPLIMRPGDSLNITCAGIDYTIPAPPRAAAVVAYVVDNNDRRNLWVETADGDFLAATSAPPMDDAGVRAAIIRERLKEPTIRGERK